MIRHLQKNNHKRSNHDQRFIMIGILFYCAHRIVSADRFYSDRRCPRKTMQEMHLKLENAIRERIVLHMTQKTTSVKY